MRRNVHIIIMLAFLAALSGCTPQGGFMDGMPGSVNGVTDVGNPNDEIEAPTAPKGIYVNAEFDVAIEYPVDWSLELDDRYEARFSSEDDESAIASFMWLEEGDTFDAFLDEVAGDASGLVMMEDNGFVTFLCETVTPGEDGGMTVASCYLHGIDDRGEFAMIFSAQLYGSVSQFHIVPMDRHLRPEKFLVTDYEIPAYGFDPSGPGKDRSSTARRSLPRQYRTSLP